MTGAIIGPPSGGQATVRNNIIDRGATPLFHDVMFPALWAAAARHGIDPVGMIAQSAKETGYGKFAGNVKGWFYNTAGIKVRHDGFVQELLGVTNPNHPLVHQMFPNWEVGAEAHAQRLLDYCLVDFPGLVVDPRHGFGNRGITLWSELGGRWAPSATYGDEVWALAQELAAE